MNVVKSRDSSLGGNAEEEKEKIVKIEIRDQIVVVDNQEEEGIRKGWANWAGAGVVR
jgi:hypothetical protein